MSNNPANAITWFSIPATDYDRSVSFYEALLGVSLINEMMGEGDQAMKFAMFPKASDEGVTGAVTPAMQMQPASGGVVIYLACADLDACLARVDGLGGGIVTPKMALPNEMGHIAVIGDLDGNPVGLHQA